MSHHRENIAALATPVGTAAIAMLRVSGDDSARLAGEIFGRTPLPRTAYHGDYRDRRGTVLDDVVFTFFRGPGSYTGEDSLEISCHGNPFVAQKILEDLLARGCRAAMPGEFTQRAFLNGRMDLSQAEAVMDLIHARSERALAAANQQLRGSLGRKMEEITAGLIDALAHLEAYIDFPEEDLPPEDRAAIEAKVRKALGESERLLATSHYGEILREGVKVVIVGEPNAGKSSLLNRLVGRERALVSPEAGTTRDFIEERIMIGPHFVRLIDTAGLNPAPGEIEKLGIEKTIEQVEAADVILLVLEAGRTVPEFSRGMMSRIRNGPTLPIWNKSDLLAQAETVSCGRELSAGPGVRISALTGDGIDGVKAKLVDICNEFALITGEDLIAISARHSDALEHAQRALRGVLDQLSEKAGPELISSDLRSALDALGAITGKLDHEEVLDRLFSTFCIGK